LWTDLGFAVAAGSLAAVNPCGFAMLPGYLVLCASQDGGAGRVAVARVLQGAAAITAGFVCVFGSVGLLLAPLSFAIQRWAPAASIVIGLVLAILGVSMLAGRGVTLRMRIARPQHSFPDSGPRPRDLFLYGVAYAIASLGCTLGPFLVAVGGSLRASSLGESAAALLAYALGMGLVVCLVAVAVACAKDLAVLRRRILSRGAQAVGALMLIAIGLYVAWYGAYELRLRSDPYAQDPVVSRAGQIQQELSRQIDSVGTPVLAGTAALLIVVLGVGGRRRRSPRPPTSGELVRERLDHVPARIIAGENTKDVLDEL
jgi:cytochrome c biogenesis protein CcdA